MEVELIIAAVCTFVTIWLLLYAIIDTQVYYKSVCDNDIVVFVDSKNLLYVNVIYNTGEHIKMSLFFFSHNFELV